RLGPRWPQVQPCDARPPPRAEARAVPSREGDPLEVPAEGGRGRRGYRERARVLDDYDGRAPRSHGAGVRGGPLGGDARGPADPPREVPEARRPGPAVLRGPAPAPRPLRGLRVPRVRPPRARRAGDPPRGGPRPPTRGRPRGRGVEEDPSARGPSLPPPTLPREGRGLPEAGRVRCPGAVRGGRLTLRAPRDAPDGLWTSS